MDKEYDEEIELNENSEEEKLFNQIRKNNKNANKSQIKVSDTSGDFRNERFIDEIKKDFERMGKAFRISTGIFGVCTVFIMGTIYQVIKGAYTLILSKSILYGLTKMGLLSAFFTFFFMYFYRKVFKAIDKPYWIDERGIKVAKYDHPFGNAHFQTSEELNTYWEIYESLEDTTKEVLFTDEIGRVYVLRDDKEHRRKNYNEAFFGGSGSGKSACLVKTNIYQSLANGDSLIITDSKGALYQETVKVAKKYGYIVRILNLKPGWFKNSDGFNPLSSINIDDEDQAADDAGFVANIIINSSGDEKKKDAVDYWTENAYNLLQCLALHFSTDKDEVRAGHNNIKYIYQFLSTTDVASFETVLCGKRQKDDPVVMSYKLFARAKEEVQGQIVNDLGMRIQRFARGNIGKLLSANEIDPVLPMKEKCVYYCVMSDTDTVYKCIASLFFSIMFSKQATYSDALSKEEKRKQIPVRYIMDEYANTGGIYEIDKKIATTRSRKMWISMILQDLNQLNGMYGKDRAATILNQCFVVGIIGTSDDITATYFEKRFGDRTIVTVGVGKEESSDSLLRLNFMSRRTYSYQRAPLFSVSEFISGGLEDDDIILGLGQMPPVKCKKQFAEKGGEPVHPLELLGMKLGIADITEYIPAWRRKEIAEKEEEERLRNEFIAGDEKLSLEKPNPERKEPKKNQQKEDDFVYPVLSLNDGSLKIIKCTKADSRNRDFFEENFENGYTIIGICNTKEKAREIRQKYIEKVTKKNTPSDSHKKAEERDSAPKQNADGTYTSQKRTNKSPAKISESDLGIL